VKLSPELKRQYDELCTVIDYAEGSALKKNFVKKDILKTIRRTGVLDVSSLNPGFRWNLCAARLRSGRFDNWDGWEYRSNWSITFMGYNGFGGLKIPKWMGQPTNHLVILGEQGIGDEILFASALPDLIYRIGHDAIEFQTYPRLQPIFQRSLRIKCTDRRVLSEVSDGQHCVALADLLRFYRRERSHFPGKPFLKPDPALVEEWKDRLDKLSDKPKIGIAWKARHGKLNPNDLMTEDATYISLQYGEGPIAGVYDLGQDPLTDMEGHFALIAALDKVVSVTQTVVHVAGSIGKECHAIIPPRGTGEVNNFLWYYGTGGPMVTYRSVTVYPSIEAFHEASHSRPRSVA
jgi:hypothetical protein